MLPGHTIVLPQKDFKRLDSLGGHTRIPGSQAPREVWSDFPSPKPAPFLCALDPTARAQPRIYLCCAVNTRPHSCPLFMGVLLCRALLQAQGHDSEQDGQESQASRS